MGKLLEQVASKCGNSILTLSLSHFGCVSPTSIKKETFLLSDVVGKAKAFGQICRRQSQDEQKRRTDRKQYAPGNSSWKQKHVIKLQAAYLTWQLISFFVNASLLSGRNNANCAPLSKSFPWPNDKSTCKCCVHRRGGDRRLEPDFYWLTTRHVIMSSMRDICSSTLR